MLNEGTSTKEDKKNSRNKDKTITPREEARQLVSKKKIEEIQSDLDHNVPDLTYEAMTSNNARRKLAGYIRRNNESIINGRPEITNYIVSQCVGLGFLEDILSNDDVEDVGWNATFLTVETQRDKVSYTREQLGGVTEKDIESIQTRLTSVQKKSFNDSNPIVDLLIGNLRVSATTDTVSPDGATFSIRKTRPKLALNVTNFKPFAPEYVLDLIRVIMLTRSNVVISGKTGTGKTELQKLMLSYTEQKDRLFMIEDVQETHVKTLFPDKDIYSMVTTASISIATLVKTSLRYNPDWIIVSETRGAEAYQMLMAILSGNNIVTTLHAQSAKAIPKRFANMIAMEYANTTEDSLMNDIWTYFDFGFHIQKVWLKDPVTGKSMKVRFLQEIVQYSPDEEGGARPIFRQRFRLGKFYITTDKLSEDYMERMNLQMMEYQLPEKHDEERKDLPEEEQTILTHLANNFGDATKDTLRNTEVGKGMHNKYTFTREKEAQRLSELKAEQEEKDIEEQEAKDILQGKHKNKVSEDEFSSKVPEEETTGKLKNEDTNNPLK